MRPGPRQEPNHRFRGAKVHGVDDHGRLETSRGSQVEGDISSCPDRLGQIVVEKDEIELRLPKEFNRSLGRVGHGQLVPVALAAEKGQSGLAVLNDQDAHTSEQTENRPASFTLRLALCEIQQGLA